MMKKSIWAALTLALAMLLLAACSNIDVVLKYAPQSFGNIAKAFPAILSEGEDIYTVSVDGQTKLEVSRDYSKPLKGDIVISTPIQPFVNAGLDPAKLPEGYQADDTNLYLTGDFGSGSGKTASATKAIFESVQFDRNVLSYHQDLDHYGIGLSRGKFEFAKDYTKNDKDIVFVIYAAPLAELGVDVQNVDGWTFKTMKDTSGNDIDVLLKPFDLK